MSVTLSAPGAIPGASTC